MMDKFAETSKLVHIGVILDLNSPVGSVANACIPMAISDFYAAHPNFRTRLSLHLRSSHDVLGATFTALELINKEEVNAIIGPERSTQARVVMDIGLKAQVPIISYSATSPSLSTTQNPFFLRTALDDGSQAKAIAAMVQAYRWHEVVLLYEDTEYGSGLIPYLTDEFQQFDIRVSSRFSISLDSTNFTILKMLNKVMAMQTRVIIVHMTSSLGAKLFLLAKEASMISEGYAWIITDGLSSLLDPMGAKVIGSMQGVLGIRPYIPQSRRLQNFKRKWNREIRSGSTKLNIYGYWAYDTVWALAKSIEMVHHESSGVTRQTYRTNATQIPEIRVSTVGRMIRNKLVKTKFKGVSGDFSLVGGQLQSSVFEIINVVDKMEKVVGYWTLENGLTPELGKATYSTPLYHELKPHIWPGNTNTKPLGWTIPVAGKKLRIGVPVKLGFDTYVKVKRDPYTNELSVTGFSYDVFLEALALLPFAVPPKPIPYTIGSNTSSGTYDELLYNLKLQCIELFLSKYCDKYMTAGPTYKTDGFGFAFPQGSPLVSYISRAILSVTENKSKMDALEHKYFSQQKACPIDVERTKVSSDSLSLYSFGGLFIITAVASLCSLTIYFTKFLQSHWSAVRAVHDDSVWSKISELVKLFDDQSPYPVPATDVNATNSTSQSVEALADVGNEDADTGVGDNISRSSSNL
ncbi:hypothetical protein V6N11_082932 [Hibiscus sabdariffa]|uniref:Ionotropic glutamate receptor C-terminal domain-containing protein n=1 Tax=Hibiscus sabdariffa TaxID=183260 RepID=A0ABR2QKD4_9ROSI